MAKDYSYFRRGSEENQVLLYKTCPIFCAFGRLLARKSIRFVDFCLEPEYVLLIHCAITLFFYFVIFFMIFWVIKSLGD